MLSVTNAAREAASLPAVIAGDRQLTFDEVRRQALDLAEEIQRISPNIVQPVAFVAYPTLESLLLCYSLFELGRTALPLNPRLLGADHEFLVAQAGAVELAFQQGTLQQVREATPTGYTPALRHPAALVATSGSTGRAKLVRLSEQALVAAAAASAERLLWMKDDSWLLSLSLCHIGGLSIATRCLLARRPVVLSDPRGGPAELTRLIQRHRVTMMSLVSTQLHRLLAGDYSLRGSKLRVMLLGGMHADPWLVGAARASKIPVLTTYGMTETASQIATQKLSDLRSLIGPCHDVGPPLEHVEVKIADDEIVVRGPMLFDGYVTDSEVSKTWPHSPPPSVHAPTSKVPKLREGWFHTGDWGRLDKNGRLTVIGRSADRIVTAGENVAPAEVERVLESLPEIERACVFGAPDAVRGEQVAAAVVLREGHSLNLRDFEDQVTKRLASFKRPWMIAIVSEFVMTPTGKLDRTATARMAANHLQPVNHHSDQV